MVSRVLILKPGKLSLLCVEKDDIYTERYWSFSGSDVPHSVGVHLSDNNQFVYSLIFDLSSEEGHFETIPSVGFRDRKHLYKRLQDKHFSTALVSAVHSNGYRKTGGVLVTGIAEEALLLKTLEVAERSGIFLRAIDSPLTLVGRLCKQLGKNKGAQLLVIGTDQSRYRMIACVEGCPVYNRQIKTDTNDPQSLNRSVTETLTYLKRCEINGWDVPVVTLMGTPECDVNRMSTLLDSASVRQICTLYSDAFAERVPDQLPVNSRSVAAIDKMYAVHAAKSGSGYASAHHRQTYLKRKFRSAMVAAVISAAGGSVSTVAIANKIQAEYKELSARYQQSIESVSSVDLQNDLYDYSVEAVRQALVTARLIEVQSERSPVGFLAELASVVGEEPSISVSAVSWEQEDKLDEKSLQAIIRKPEGIDKLRLNHFYRATVNGSIEGNTGSVLDRFENFVSSLRNSSENHTVVVVEAPFGMDDNSKTTAADLAESKAVFAIELVRKGELR